MHFDRQAADNRFLAFCLKHGEEFQLEDAVWLLAQTQYPDINVEAYQALLDSFAGVLREQLDLGGNAKQIVATETNNVGFVRRINDFVGAFADRYVVSSRRLKDSEMPRGTHCPRPRAYRLPQPLGTALILQYEMGEPLRLPKWEHKFESTDEQIAR